MDPYVDEWTLMAFDYMGPGFSNLTGHLSNVYPSKRNPGTSEFNTAQAIDYYKSQVASPRKIILGMPLYGRSFANTSGLGQIFNGTGDGSWEAGVLDYKSIPLNGSIVYTDRQAVASWSHNNKTRQLVSFDTPEIQVLKTKYLKKEKLGGAWWWDSSSDRTDDKSLVSTVRRTCLFIYFVIPSPPRFLTPLWLGKPIILISFFVKVFKAIGGHRGLQKNKNWIDYPLSKYDNVRRAALKRRMH